MLGRRDHRGDRLGESGGLDGCRFDRRCFDGCRLDGCRLDGCRLDGCCLDGSGLDRRRPDAGSLAALLEGTTGPGRPGALRSAGASTGDLALGTTADGVTAVNPNLHANPTEG
ncbi:MAG: pentapeptide repeat-containing protein, partial [Candidatus Nanopelagicales bacterium]